MMALVADKPKMTIVADELKMAVVADKLKMMAVAASPEWKTAVLYMHVACTIVGDC